MGMNASKLDRKVQFQRFTEVQDDFGTVMEWAEHGGKVWAHRKDVSDGEKMAAQEVQASITARFTVRSSEFSRDIDPKDRLKHGTQEFNITGTKETGDGRLSYIEITCSARADL